MSELVKTISQFQNKSYRNFFPQIIFSAEDNYFLQFNSYVVYLPSIFPPSNFLNIFEISVLKLLSIAPFNPQELSEKLCLQVDFIKFICAELVELNFIDDFREITDAGKNFLGQKSKLFTYKNILPYLVLTTRDTGEIFPKLFPRNTWQTAKIFGTTIVQNDEKSFRNFKRRCIFVEQKIKTPSAIPQKILHEIVENFNAANANKIFIEQDLNIPSAYSAPIFLHIKTILKSRIDNFFLVSDGGESHNDFLYSYVCRQQKNILTNLKWHGL